MSLTSLASADRKTFVKVATTAQVTLATALQTIDGVVPEAGDTVLVKNQSDASENGVYFVKEGGWLRAPMVLGSLILVEKGIVHADSLWTLTNDLPLNVGSSPLSFAELTETGAVAAAAKTTTGNLTLPVDYNLSTAVDPPAGAIFSTQAEIDAYLASQETTAFKHLQLAYNALPDVIAHDHTVTFNCAAGVHRPVSTQPGLAAWALDSKQVLGNLVIQGALPSLYTPYIGIASNISITAVQAANRDPFVDVSGVPFAVSAWTANTSYTAGDRRWNGVALGGTSGSAASIVAGASTNRMRLTGLTGMTEGSLGRSLTISGAASAGNNGTFPIVNFISATSVDVLNAAAVIPDANNGAVSWAGSWTGAAASIVAGAAASHMRLTGLTGLNISAVGRYLTITGAASAANNGTWQIANFISATSCDVINPAAVIPDTNNGAISWTEKAGNTYQARISGVSAGSGGPTGTGLTDIVDNTVTWRFLQVGPAILKGSYAVFNTGQVALVHDHTGNRLNCMDVISPTPTSVLFVGRPSTIFRNSVNDTTNFKGNTWLASSNAPSGSSFSTGPYSNIRLNDCMIDPFGTANTTMENGALQLYAGGHEFTRMVLDQDSCINFPFNRTPAANGIVSWTGAKAPIKLSFCSHLNRQQTGGPSEVLLTDSGVELYGNYFTGCGSGGGTRTVGTHGHLGQRYVGNVWDSVGNNGGFSFRVENSKFTILFDPGVAGTLGVGKQNEFRNCKTSATPIVCFRFSNLDAGNAAQCRAIFKNNLSFACVAVASWAGCRPGGAGASSGLLDAGGNVGVGINIDGQCSEVLLNTGTNVTGAGGDISFFGTLYTYADVTAQGGVVNPSRLVTLRR